jgi:hypothetical protein
VADTVDGFLAALPPELERQVESLIAEAGGPMTVNQFEKAAELSTQLYQLMLEAQPAHRRYHKGWPLHNLGLALALTNRGIEAANTFLLAFVEDAISRAEESPIKMDELDRPAARVLAAGLTQSELADRATRIRAAYLAGEREILRDPAIAVEKLDLTPPPNLAIAILRQQRIVGQFESKWEQRVFVAGYYGHIAALNEIRAEVKALGFDPVLTLDFEVPDELGHHHSLMLLHECRQAIFELTQEAGQLMELERTRDYEIGPILAVFQGTSEHQKQLSGMTSALLGRLGISPLPYSSTEELRRIVRDWLLRIAPSGAFK